MATPNETRVCVFFDWQNCYRTARDAFQLNGGGIPGNVKPLSLAKMLAAKRDNGAVGRIVSVRIFTGRASQRHDPKTYAANQRQFEAWKASDPEVVEVFARTLDYSLGKPREKGVDVHLAIDLVKTTLIGDNHDVAIVVSADTDLLPALELIVQQTGPSSVEVAAWKGVHWAPSPLAVDGVRIRQHLMDQALYERAKDTTDYTAAKPRSHPQGRRLPPR